MHSPLHNKLKTVYTQSKTRLPVLPQLGILSLVLLVLFGSAITATLYSATESEQGASAVVTPPAGAPEMSYMDTQTTDESFSWDTIDVTANAAFVWDVKNQRPLFAKNADAVLPLASITKLMTVLLAHELLTEDVEVIVDKTAARQDGGSYLAANDSLTHTAIATMALMTSANDGAYALAAAAGEQLAPNDPANTFVQAMNIRAEELDLHNTTFRNPTGLDISATEAGAFSTAKEAAFLMEYLLRNQPQLLSITTQADSRVYNQDGYYYDIENTNHYIHQIPNLLGSKTGYTELAGGNLVVAFNAGLDRPVIISVLNSTWSERFTDVLTLVTATQQALDTN